MNTLDNLILDTDSYKASHYLQYPPGTSALFAYLESRGGKYNSTVFFGLQYLLLQYLTKPPTLSDVDEAAHFFKAHGLPFPEDAWRDVARQGYIPLRIRAVSEGTVVPTGHALMTVESTDPKAFWMVTWFETMLMRLWYPITVATQSREIKKVIATYLQRTSDNPDAELPFKLHDFGSRGVSSRESAGIGGMAHLVNFKGSDTVWGVHFANRYYHEPMAGFSIPAAEHSTVTTWGRDGESAAFANMLRQFAKPGAILAVVSDSYDLDHAVSVIWGRELKHQVLASGATVVIRPDSGDPTTMVLNTLNRLAETYGTKINQKGFRVLNTVRVIQGDGVNQSSIEKILAAITEAGYSTTNVAFGMGGALLQQVDRDTQRFAYKTSAAKINGLWFDVRKEPITDPGKWSKGGRLHLVKDATDQFKTVTTTEMEKGVYSRDYLETVFENGKLDHQTTLEAVRLRAEV
jgi:nicotinamide phosphoribosyltransferase